jgi:general secretion pathway protein N
MLRSFLYALVALVSVGATALAVAPAQWVASAIGRATGERVILAEASGSAWRGQAGVVLSPGTAAEASARMSLPEPLSWQLSPWKLLAGRIDLILTHPSALAQPLQLRTDLAGRVELLGTTLRLPAAVLAGLGAPFNTIKPGGLISVTWQRLELHHGRLQGDIVGEWQFASSALTPVAPFGHYRLLAEGGFPGTRLKLLTLSGPLELNGDGTIDDGGRLRLSGRARAAADADASTKAQLAGLLSLLGKRDGDSAILSIGN